MNTEMLKPRGQNFGLGLGLVTSGAMLNYAGNAGNAGDAGDGFMQDAAAWRCEMTELLITSYCSGQPTGVKARHFRRGGRASLPRATTLAARAGKLTVARLLVHSPNYVILQ